MNARIVDVYINLGAGVEISPDTGKPKQLITRVRRTERILFRWHLYADDALTPYALAAGMTYTFGVDNVYTAGNADLVTSLPARFNSADWTGTDGWSLSAGRICCLAVFGTSQLATEMGTAAEKKMFMAVYATPAGEDPFLLFHLPLMVDGVTVEPGGSAPVNETDTYITVSALAAMLQIPAGKRLVVSDAGAITVGAIS